MCGKFQFFQHPPHLEWVYLYICAPPNFLLCHQGVSSPQKKIPELRPRLFPTFCGGLGSKVLKYPRTERSISLSVFYFEVSFKEKNYGKMIWTPKACFGGAITVHLGYVFLFVLFLRVRILGFVYSI